MFNDVLDVRAGNLKRKRNLARVAQKLMMNSKRASGIAGVSRVGGGLGRQQAARFRPLAQRNLGLLARLNAQGRPEIGEAIGRFGVTERQPGAYDPGGTAQQSGSMVPAEPEVGEEWPGSDLNDEESIAAEGAEWPGSDSDIAGPYSEFQSQGQGQISAGPAGTNTGGESGIQAPSGDPFAQTIVSPNQIGGGGQSGGFSNPYASYVNYQGSQIPLGLYKALMMSGELW